MKATAQRSNTEVYYRIIVHGVIPDGWKNRLAGMCIVQASQSPNSGVTRLEGLVKDQSELMGVLESLYRLNTTILNVERVVKLPTKLSYQ